MQFPPLLFHPSTRLILACSAALCAGAVMEQVWIRSTVDSSTLLTLVQDARPRVCTVEVDGMRDGSIAGRITGSGRVFIGTTQAIPNASGSFLVAAGDFLTNRITITIPPGMKFVASKRGTKYYALQSSQAKSIAPANRVYFATPAEAEAAGFRLGK